MTHPTPLELIAHKAMTDAPMHVAGSGLTMQYDDMVAMIVAACKAAGERGPAIFEEETRTQEQIDLDNQTDQETAELMKRALAAVLAAGDDPTQLTWHQLEYEAATHESLHAHGFWQPGTVTHGMNVYLSYQTPGRSIRRVFVTMLAVR